jgi:hypothetical protein
VLSSHELVLARDRALARSPARGLQRRLRLSSTARKRRDMEREPGRRRIVLLYNSESFVRPTEPNDGLDNESEPPRPQRVWRDPDQLEPYLDDALEHAVYEFRMSTATAARFMLGMMSTPDDPLLDEAVTNREEAAEAAALRALDRLSPSATECYCVAKQVHAELDKAPAAVLTLGHHLRELDGTIRDVWWDLSCFVDQGARQAREDAKRDNPSARDATHATQIEVLSRRLDLTEAEQATWLEAAGLLPKLAHRGRIGPSRRMSANRQQFMADALALFLRIARATEATYGDAVLRAAALLEAGPSKDVTRVLSHHFPHHPPLRRWLLAQVDDAAWLRPLHKADMLAPCESMYPDADGSPVAPAAPGARATARAAALLHDDQLLHELVSDWLTVNNPRLHTDVVQILIEASTPLYEHYVDSLRTWLATTREHASIVRLLGDAGVLRFPSHCLRLAARALADDRRDLAHQLADASASALAAHAPDRHSYTKAMKLALLGAAPVLNKDENASSFLVDALTSAAPSGDV